MENIKKTLSVLCLLIPYVTYADISPKQTAEINHLLNFVKQSDCTINRNGTDHTGKKSAEHIEKKYHYFKDDIETTEDFIQYSATKSTLSGDFYVVSCPNQKAIKAQPIKIQPVKTQPIKTQKWLLNELALFRKNNTADHSKKTITLCTEPRPQICTMEYMPVCAALNNKTTKTYASACNACADKNVISYQKDEC